MSRFAFSGPNHKGFQGIGSRRSCRLCAASDAGAQAVDHIKDKYDHYRDDIHSAEDFIALAASKSAMSGKPYLVTCDGTTEPAADWITRELNAFRQRSAS